MWGNPRSTKQQGDLASSSHKTLRPRPSVFVTEGFIPTALHHSYFTYRTANAVLTRTFFHKITLILLPSKSTVFFFFFEFFLWPFDTDLFACIIEIVLSRLLS